ncbi:MAG: quinol:cytochrome C oxidoreductase [Bacteroidota bacterium]
MNAPQTDHGGFGVELAPRAKTLVLVLASAGLCAAGAAYLLDPARAAFAHLVSYLFLVSVTVGSLFLIALEYITGAVWSVPMRRVSEALAGLTPWLAIAAAPLYGHLHELFHWTHAEAVAQDPLLEGKTPYLNVTFFTVRTVGSILLWSLFAHLFIRNSLRQDATRDPLHTRANVRLAAVFLPVFAVTLTLTAVDWTMSLEPHWFSTILGVYFFAGTVLAGLASATYIVVRLMEAGRYPHLRKDHLYSLGALMFGFVNFWAYIAFSQFLLIWYANLPEETFWFMARWHNGWEYVSVLLILVHFLIPYFLLLPQEAKMNPQRLKFMALWILAAHALDLYWLVMPTHSPSPVVSWQEAGFAAAAVALLVLGASSRLRRTGLTPVGDPKLPKALEFRL